MIYWNWYKIYLGNPQIWWLNNMTLNNPHVKEEDLKWNKNICMWIKWKHNILKLVECIKNSNLGNL